MNTAQGILITFSQHPTSNYNIL